MTLHEEMQKRAERLLSGERNVEDLHRLIMWLRGRTNGSIQEIGHFLAHFDERDRGESTEEMTDYFIVNRLRYQGYDREVGLRDGKPSLAFDKLPRDFGEGLKAALRIIGAKKLAAKTGLREILIPVMIGAIIGKAFMNLDGTFSLMERCNEDERMLLKHLFWNNDVRSLYNLDLVFSELVSALVKFNLIRPNDKRIDSLKTYYGLWVCKNMDKCRLKRRGIKAKLYPWVSHEGFLFVMAQALLVKNPGGGSYTNIAPFFMTKIIASEVMDDDVRKILSELNNDRGTLEIGPDQKLRFI